MTEKLSALIRLLGILSNAFLLAATLLAKHSSGSSRAHLVAALIFTDSIIISKNT